MKNDENDSILDLSVVPPFLKFEQNKFTQCETNLTPVNVNCQYLSPEMMHNSDCSFSVSAWTRTLGYFRSLCLVLSGNNFEQDRIGWGDSLQCCFPQSHLMFCPVQLMWITVCNFYCRIKWTINMRSRNLLLRSLLIDL